MSKQQDRQSSRDRDRHVNDVIRAKLLLRVRVVHFRLDTLAIKYVCVPALMREAETEARLQAFQSTPSVRHGAHGSVCTIVAVATRLPALYKYKTEDSAHCRVRCSFCKKAFSYRLWQAHAAARVNTSVMSLRHSGDDRPFDESRVRSLPVGSPHLTLIASNSCSSSHPDVALSNIDRAHTATSRRSTTHLEFCEDAAVNTTDSQQQFESPLATGYQHIVSHIDPLAVADAMPRDNVNAVAYSSSRPLTNADIHAIANTNSIFERGGMLNLNIEVSSLEIRVRV